MSLCATPEHHTRTRLPSALRATVLFAWIGVLAACQPVATTSEGTKPLDDASQWQHWFIDASGKRSAVESDTVDWSEGRVGGTGNTTMVLDCNGQDPTAFVISIESGTDGSIEYEPMTQPYVIKVRSGRRISFTETRRPGSHRGAHGHEATSRLAQALRDGSEVTFEFQQAPPHSYTLKGSAIVMDRLQCDPNLL